MVNANEHTSRGTSTGKTSGMRLLHLMKKLDIGGLERSTVEYSNRLVGRLEWIGFFAAEGRFSRGSVIDPAIRVILSKHRPESFFFFPVTLYQIFTSLRDFKITIIHYHHRIFLPAIALVRVFYPHIKIVYTHHSCFHDIITKFLVADAVICPSTGAADDFRRYNSRPALVIPHGIHTTAPVPRWRPGTPKCIGYVGRIEKNKGLETLIDAFTKLHRSDPAYRLIIRGDGTLRPALAHTIERLGLSSVTRFEGPFVDLDALYKDINLVVLPSLSLEGFGLSIVEGMAMEIPVIATRIGGMTDIIRDGIDGWLVPPADPEALSSAITFMFEDSAFRESCIREAHKRVESLFGIELAVQRYEECLASTLSTGH